MQHVTKSPLAIDQTLTYTTPDRQVTVTVQRIRADVWTVITVKRGQRVDDNSGSYGSEDIARTVARGYAELYRAEHPAEQPTTLADLAAQGRHRQVRPTMAGAHLTKLTGPQQRALNANIDGVVFVGDGITAATLRSLDRKGYGSVAYEGRRHQVVSLALNGRGLAAVSKAVA